MSLSTQEVNQAVNPTVFVAVSLAKGLKLYCKHKILPNRLWTPTNMLKTATKLTGIKYKRGEYMKAHDDLMSLVTPQFNTAEERDD